MLKVFGKALLFVYGLWHSNTPCDKPGIPGTRFMHCCCCQLQLAPCLDTPLQERSAALYRALSPLVTLSHVAQHRQLQAFYSPAAAGVLHKHLLSVLQ